MHAPASTWEGPLSIREVVQQLKTALFGPLTKQNSSEEALRAEVLRIAVWEQSVLNQQYGLAGTSTSTQKVLHRACLLWQPIFLDLNKNASPEEAPVEDTLSRQTLENLAEQGDLLSLSKGQWLPAPLRLVPISSERYLLVGGVPSSVLTNSIFRQLHLHGSFRQIDAHLIHKHQPFDGSADRWQFQTQESWLGMLPLSFQELLQQFMSTELLPETTQHAGEAYVASLDQPQHWRWQPLEKVQEHGRYLLRSQGLWGQRLYTIGQIENRRVKEQSQPLESWDIRRLCYALDNEAQRPTRAMWKQEGTLTLCSELPSRERKHLATLGSLQMNSTGSYYPRIWHILPDYEQDVQKMLRKLAITIQ